MDGSSPPSRSRGRSESSSDSVARVCKWGVSDREKGQQPPSCGLRPVSQSPGFWEERKSGLTCDIFQSAETGDSFH